MHFALHCIGCLLPSRQSMQSQRERERFASQARAERRPEIAGRDVRGACSGRVLRWDEGTLMLSADQQESMDDARAAQEESSRRP